LRPKQFTAGCCQVKACDDLGPKSTDLVTKNHEIWDQKAQILGPKKNVNFGAFWAKILRP
jgi:hypothetical protein